MEDYGWLFEDIDPLKKAPGVRPVREAQVDTTNYDTAQESNVIISEEMGFDVKQKEDDARQQVADRAAVRLEKGLKFLQDDVEVLHALSTLVEEFAKRRDAYVDEVDPRHVHDPEKNPEWAEKFAKFASKIQRVGSAPPDDAEIRSAAAEEWCREAGEVIPPRDTEMWLNMYEKWLLAMLDDADVLNRIIEGGNGRIRRLF